MDIKTKKKFLSVFLLIVILGITIFLILTVPKFIIIHNHISKVLEARQSDNIAMKSIEYSRVNSNVREYITKGNVFMMKMENNRMFWQDKSETTEYIILPDEKQVIQYDAKDLYEMEYMWISSVIDGKRGNRIWEEMLMSISCNIKTEKCNSKECYLIENRITNVDTDRVWIDKETGLIIKRTSGMGTTLEDNFFNSTVEYDYTFNEVKDADVAKPDLTGYTVIYK